MGATGVFPHDEAVVSVGVGGADSAGQLAKRVGIAVTGFRWVGERVAASLAPS